MSRITRRRFIKASAAVAGIAVAAPHLNGAESDASFASQWPFSFDRIWLGPEYWANPMQDWRIKDGRIECVNAALDRNVHILTRQLGAKSGDLRMSVRIGRVGGEPVAKGKGSAGFRIGAIGPLRDYRNSLFVANSGLSAGMTADEGLFIGDVGAAKANTINLDSDSIELRLAAQPAGDNYTLALSAHDAAGKVLGQITRENVPANQLIGNLVLVANFARPGAAGGGGGGAGARANRANANVGGPGSGQFWFADWKIEGSKVDIHDDQTFGPILFNHYTLSNGVLKITTQMPPMGEKDSQTARLQIQSEQNAAQWSTIAEEKIQPEARTATFRIDKWNDKIDVPYRLAYTLLFTNSKSQEYYWSGTIRRDPVGQPVITVADVSCNIHAAFPNSEFVANMAKVNPDLLAFVGDQFYEQSGGYGVQRAPLEAAILDYLRKWYMHGWTWRELTKNCPSISLPDDHDVYQGNVWGESGAPRHGTQEMGGYDMPGEWVNVVHRTQTSHHPDAYDPTPVKQNISCYYGPMTYGGISFAIIADRQFKSGPEGKVPPTGDRGDHVTKADWDPKTADVPGLELLGERQLKFLREWATDWKHAQMKAVISQTIFTAMATTHGANRERLRADYDANGWPQTPRNKALREIRKCFPVHIAGDQHLPAIVHYGIDEHRDAPVAFAGPAVNVGYPRWFEPEKPGANRPAGAPENTGDFLDHFGHPMTVLAVASGPAQFRKTTLELLKDKSSGLGLVRFDKPKRKIIFECWPFLADPTAPNSQFPGWPVTIDMLDNYGRKAVAHLPSLQINGVKNPVVQIIEEKDGRLVYALRVAGQSFQPKVFAEGKYTIRVSEPESGRLKEIKSIEAVADNKKTLEIDL